MKEFLVWYNLNEKQANPIRHAKPHLIDKYLGLENGEKLKLIGGWHKRIVKEQNLKYKDIELCFIDEATYNMSI